MSKEFYSIFSSQVQTVHDQQPAFTDLFYKGINLSRHDQDIQYVDDDPSRRHIIVLIDTLHMVLLILFPDQEYQQGLILHLRKIIYKKRQFLLWAPVSAVWFHRGANNHLKHVLKTFHSKPNPSFNGLVLLPGDSSRESCFVSILMYLLIINLLDFSVGSLFVSTKGLLNE